MGISLSTNDEQRILFYCFVSLFILGDYNMFRRSGAVLLVIVSFMTKSNSYGDYQVQMRNFYDSLYQRSFTKEKPSRDAGPSNFIDLKMPGVHAGKVGKLF